MSFWRQPTGDPLWRDEFSVRADDERYVTRRQFTKFLMLTSVAMFAGNAWILVRSWLRRPASLPEQVIGPADAIPVGGVALFTYPTPNDPCIVVRRGKDDYVAFSQKCTHLSCAVFYSRQSDRFECPCHRGVFSATDGAPLAGPPRRPLPRIRLDRRGGTLVAVGVEGA